MKENLQRARYNRAMKAKAMERVKKFDKLPDSQKKARGIARGKAAAKRKFKVYPSAYANAYASKICAGKIKDPSGVKRKDFRGSKAEGGLMEATARLKRQGLKGGGICTKGMNRDAVGKNS